MPFCIPAERVSAVYYKVQGDWDSVDVLSGNPVDEGAQGEFFEDIRRGFVQNVGELTIGERATPAEEELVPGAPEDCAYVAVRGEVEVSELLVCIFAVLFHLPSHQKMLTAISLT